MKKEYTTEIHCLIDSLIELRDTEEGFDVLSINDMIQILRNQIVLEKMQIIEAFYAGMKYANKNEQDLEYPASNYYEIKFRKK